MSVREKERERDRERERQFVHVAMTTICQVLADDE